MSLSQEIEQMDNELKEEYGPQVFKAMKKYINEVLEKDIEEILENYVLDATREYYKEGTIKKIEDYNIWECMMYSQKGWHRLKNGGIKEEFIDIQM